MKPIADIKKELNLLVPQSIADVLRELKALLPDQSAKYRDVLALEGRLNDTNKNRLFGVISDDQLQLEYNRLRKDLFDLIESLTEADFSPEGAQPIPKKGRQGSVLYRIPHTMPLGKESKCLIRIALDKETIIQNIDLDEHVQLKDIRVSDIMLVELLDPNPEQPFRIRTLNTPEQFIEPGENTDWIFYVTPNRPGIFPLALKVSVIELIQGKERRREIVLEEKVQIIAEGAVEDIEDEETLQAAGYALSFATETKAAGRTVIQFPVQPSVVPALPSMTRNVRRRSGSFLRRPAFLLAGLMAFVSLSWAVAPAQVEWLAVRYLANDEDAYDWYIERRKETPLRENAFIRKAEIQETKEEAVAAYHIYLEAYPEAARFRETAKWEIGKLENNPVVLLEYLREFPEAKLALKDGLDRAAIEEKVTQQVDSLTDTAQLKEVAGLLDAVKNQENRDRIRKRLEIIIWPESNRLVPEQMEEIQISEKNENPLLNESKIPIRKETPDQESDFLEKSGESLSIEKIEPQKQESETKSVIPPAETKAFTGTYGQIADKEGHNYRTILLNGQTWIADNLNIEVPDSWCYDNDPANCKKYGRLYTWAAAKEGCVALGAGWRVPSDQEWLKLAEIYGGLPKKIGVSFPYRYLIEGGKSGFEAGLAGVRLTEGKFDALGNSGFYWSSTKYQLNLNEYAESYWFMLAEKTLWRNTDKPSKAFSVRCLKD